MFTSPLSASPSRREFLTVTATAAGLAAAACAPTQVGGGGSTAASATQDLVGDGRKRRILLRGGVVLTLDAKVGDFEKADVLIDGKTIAQVAPDISARRCRSRRLLGHDRHARLHHDAPSSVRDLTAKHHRGWTSRRSVAAGDLWVRGPEHLDCRVESPILEIRAGSSGTWDACHTTPRTATSLSSSPA